MGANERRPDTRLRFAIDRWQAWAPGVDEPADWSAWLAGERFGAATDAVPDVQFLPALLRRRLGRVGRMALATAWPCSEGRDEVDLVFGSRHGSLDRLAQLLAAVGHGEMPSAKTFSLSVHNAVPGLFSIARHNHRRATAVAAGEDTLAMTLLDGATIVAADHVPVLVTYVDDRPPEVYADLLPTPSTHPFAVSLLLLPPEPGGAGVHLAAVASGAGAKSPESAVMRFLLGMQSTATLGVRQGWRLDRDRG